MVQNMSAFICPTCHTKTDIFGGQNDNIGNDSSSSSSSSNRSTSSSDIAQKCEKLGLPILGNVPLDARICADADRGKPTVVAEMETESGNGNGTGNGTGLQAGHSERKEAFDKIAEKIKGFLDF